ncbi:MAG: hypothetical protein PHY34_02830 [Patescibacteria group bacterium]|nr:hypothetical protein [Patescibacteria group bacterium]MDD5715393.1 hypothetical protein [Patescibacteria group bacterium]
MCTLCVLAVILISGCRNDDTAQPVTVVMIFENTPGNAHQAVDSMRAEQAFQALCANLDSFPNEVTFPMGWFEFQDYRTDSTACAVEQTVTVTITDADAFIYAYGINAYWAPGIDSLWLGDYFLIGDSLCVFDSLPHAYRAWLAAMEYCAQTAPSITETRGFDFIVGFLDQGIVIPENVSVTIPTSYGTVRITATIHPAVPIAKPPIQYTV